MSIFSSTKKEQPSKEKKNSTEPIYLGKGFEDREKWLKNCFHQSSDVIFHTFIVNETQCAVVYLQGVVDQSLFDENVLKPILSTDFTIPKSDFFHKLLDLKQISAMSSKLITDMHVAAESVLEGEVLLVIEGENRMLAFPFTKFDKRSINEPTTENVIRGPKESFVEDISTNITLIRRRIKSSSLKMEQKEIGKITKTRVVIGYLEGICKPELVEEVRNRLSEIQMDGVIGSSYLEEYMDDYPYSPFPQMEKTERPDVVSASLLEGRVVVFVDGTPIPLLIPGNFYMFLQSAEDYYQRYISATWIRCIRYIFLLASLFLPSFYIAITTFHPEMIPTNLLISVAGARDNVPFPALVEALLMELAFEGLREAGIRTPKAVGQAISILGALVIGQAAVQAGIVSAPMVIVVSLTGISSFIIPHYDLAFSLRFLRFPIMILAGTFGLFGLTMGALVIYIHLVSLRSFGMPYLAPTAPLRLGDLKDVFIRAPWWMMNRRPTHLSPMNPKRANTKKISNGEDEGD
jgi:spore germination protein